MALLFVSGVTSVAADASAGSIGSANALAENLVRVSGTVVDADNLPVPGAVVYVPSNTAYSTTTDDAGAFSFSVPAGSTLRVSILGYGDYDLTVNKDTANLVITLQKEVNLLDELVFVGYGVQKKSDITGAIASVEVEQIKKIPTTAVAEMLRGSVAGVQVNLSSAAPGGSSSVLIRGRRSLSADNTPLYVVDGVFMRSIDDLDGNDIQSMEVLKDAAAQAIYGARAANGVILITTKSGKINEKSSVSYDGYVSVQTLNRNFEYWDLESWMAMREYAYTNYYGTYDESQCYDGDLLKAKNEGAYIDWEKAALKNAIERKHNITVQGGGKNNSYAASVGYFSQDGMVPTSWFERFTGRLNFNQKVTDWLSFGSILALGRSNRRIADSGFYHIMSTIPLGYVYEEDGVTPRRDVSGFATNVSATNALWNLKERSDMVVADRLNGTFYVDLTLLPGLTYRLNTNYSTRISNTSDYYTTLHSSYTGVGGKAEKSNTRTSDFLVENILNYNLDFAAKHHFDATLMQSIAGSRSENSSITAQGMVDDTYGADAIGTALEFLKPTYGKSGRNIVSFLGRVRYSYDSRYLFSAAVRVDGSSVFGASNKYGVFPSVAVAWRINKEPFMQGTSNWLSNLKLRASYGEVGNQAVDPYTTLGTTTTSYIEYNSTAVGFLPTTKLYNPDLKWETSATTNLGLDFGFFKDRINGSVEVYNTDTRDLLVTRQLPSSTGYVSQLDNLGQVNNKGIEITLNTTPVSTKELQWDVNLTWSKNKNTIIAIDGRVDEDGKPLNDLNNKWFIGEPMNVEYNYKMLGVFKTEDATNGVIAESNTPDNEPGMIHIADLNDDKKVTDEDKILYRKDPDWIAGLNTALFWKGFDLSLIFDAQYGGYLKNDFLYNTSYGGNMNGRTGGVKRDYWREDNQIDTYFKPVMQSTMSPYYDIPAIQDASFIRLRNLTFGYSLPKSVINHVGLSKCRLYFAGTNLWYKTGVTGYGPGADGTDYPQSRMFQFGINVTF